MANGCRWITGTTMRRNEAVNVFCNKIRQEGYDFCPKHVLFYEDEQHKEERRLAKQKETRAYRDAQRKALAESPLAAHNPKFDRPVRMEN
jgi:hypothetical protein